MNRRDVRAAEFARQREWAERFDSAALRQMLADKRFHGGLATAVREVLRARGEGEEAE